MVHVFHCGKFRCGEHFLARSAKCVNMVAGITYGDVPFGFSVPFDALVIDHKY